MADHRVKSAKEKSSKKRERRERDALDELKRRNLKYPEDGIYR